MNGQPRGQEVKGQGHTGLKLDFGGLAIPWVEHTTSDGNVALDGMLHVALDATPEFYCASCWRTCSVIIRWWLGDRHSCAQSNCCLPAAIPAVGASVFCFNLLTGTLIRQSNRSLYSNTMMVRWPLMGGLLHLVQRRGPGCGWAAASLSPLFAVTNVTAHGAHPSTASVQRTSYYSMWHYKCHCSLKG